MSASQRLVSTRIELNGSLEEMNEYLYSRGYTDGLPVIPPTEERVRAMVDYVKRDPQEVVAAVPPARGEATVEKIAVNAVMAGCKPEYLPVLLAAVEAACEEKVNLHGLQATTNPVGPMLLINGPIRNELDINCRAGAFGAGWRANAAIGRAMRLLLVNIGGATPGPVDKATQGYPGKFGFCFGELEEDSPWEPLHVERGFAPEESTVTVTGAQGTSSINAGTPISGHDLIKALARGMLNVGVNNFVMRQEGEPLLALCPPHAEILAREGYSKQQVKEYLFQEVRMPLDWLAEHTKTRVSNSGRVVDGAVPLASSAEQFMVVVVGGEGGLHSTFIPTFGDTWSVTKRIQKP